MIAFDIKPQPLDSALVPFSLASGMLVLVDSGLLKGKVTTGLTGTYTPRQGLHLLLQGTGLSPRYSEASSVTLEAAGAGMPASIEVNTMRVEASRFIGGTPAYLQYGDYIRDAIIRSLRTDSATSAGRYAITLSVWIARTGRIMRVVLVRSSGVAERDRAIVAAVAGLRLTKPPPDELPQPVTLELEARPPS